ncbi:hypothetical protein, partial [Treponema sp.]|uniref:hypothetical protein n=1 Tax=Treponema sp. TaxID=166 RepID=UPI00388DB918
SLKITLDKKSTVFYIRINNSGCQLLAGFTRIKTFYRSLLNLQKGLHTLKKNAIKRLARLRLCGV